MSTLLLGGHLGLVKLLTRHCKILRTRVHGVDAYGSKFLVLRSRQMIELLGDVVNRSSKVYVTD